MNYLIPIIALSIMMFLFAMYIFIVDFFLGAWYFPTITIKKRLLNSEYAYLKHQRLNRKQRKDKSFLNVNEYFFVFFPLKKYYYKIEANHLKNNKTVIFYLAVRKLPFVFSNSTYFLYNCDGKLIEF